MTGKYTPGPWVAQDKGIHPSNYICGPEYNNDGVTDADVICYMVGMDQEANARLIAAAPDLLEALKKLLEEKDDYMLRNNLGDPMKESVSKIARAAIAKAEGCV